MGSSLLSGIASYFIPVLHTDEGGWAVLGKHAWDGNLYQLVTDHKPPLLIQLHWLFTLGERSLEISHFFQSLWMGLGAIGLYTFFKIYLQEKKAWLGAILFALASGLVNENAFHAERLYLPFLIFAALLAQKMTQKKTQIFLLCVVVGFLLGAAVCIKQTALLLGGPILLFLIQCRKPLLALLASVLGILTLTWISWSLTHVPWDVIWKEGYLNNFQFMHFAARDEKSNLLDIFQNIFFTLGVQFFPLNVGAVLGLRHWKNLKKLSSHPLILILTFFVTTLITVSLGQRFYQYYYLAALPLFSFLAAVGVDLKQKRFYLGAALFVLFVLNMRVGVLQILDKNKNWDHEIQRVISEIKKDSTPEEFIWVSHNLFSIYHFSERNPAVKHIWFPHALHYADPYHALGKWLREDLTNPNYQLLLEQLKINQPRVIFWTERAVNTAAHRLKLENFPSIHQFIENFYIKKWQTPLGSYYLWKNGK